MGVMMRGVIVLVDMVDQYELLEAVKEKKADNECNHCTGGIDPLLAGQLKNLGQNVKTHDADEHASGKAENKVQPIAEPECKQSAGKGRKECRKRTVIQRS